MLFLLNYVNIKQVYISNNFLIQNNQGTSAQKIQQLKKNKKERRYDIIEKLLNPKIDYVFKRIFGHVGNEDITAELLSSILNRKVTDLKLDNNPILEKDMLDDKMGILDIKAKIDNSINCDIEMQIVDRRNIEKRILYYWSKMYTSSIKYGGKFKDLQKGIVILISDYELNSLKEIKKYITKWNIREEEYSQDKDMKNFFNCLYLLSHLI